MELPGNIKFQVELQALIAILGTEESYLGHEAYSVSEPPPSFTYIPPGALPVNNGNVAGEHIGWVLHEVAAALLDRGLTTNMALSDGTTLPDSKRYCSKEFMKLRDIPSSETGNMWVVSHDPDINEHHDTEYGWVGVKVLSPEYAVSEPFQPPFSGMSDVLDVLHHKFVAIPNHETRLRIQISPLEGNLTLNELKAVASLLWIADPVLTKLHPEHCGPGSSRCFGLQFTNIVGRHGLLNAPKIQASADKVEDPWNNRLSPNRPPLSLSPHPGHLNDPKYGFGIKSILESASFAELVKLLDLHPIARQVGDEDSCCEPAYDFQELTEYEKGATIKFNQHCGTFDFESISHWVSVCAKVVSFAVEKSAQHVQHELTALRERLQVEDFTACGLLEFLGLTDTAKYYKTKGSTIKIPDLQSWPERKPAIPAYQAGNKVNIGQNLLYHADRNWDDALGWIAETLIGWDRSPRAAYTMGLELELMLPYCNDPMPVWSTDTSMNPGDNISSPDNNDPDPEDGRESIRCMDSPTRVYEMVARRMVESGHFAVSPEGHWESDDYTWVFKRRLAEVSGMALDPRFTSEWQSWSVEEDSSLNHYGFWRGYEGLIGIEIIGPIMRDLPECWESLLGAINGLRERVRLTVDKSCGMHVNVGKGIELMSYYFFRKLTCLIFCADHLIFSLCQPHRRQNSYYCTSLRHPDILQSLTTPKNVEERPGFEEHFPVSKLDPVVKTCLKTLWDMKNMDDLASSISWNGNKGCVSLDRVTNSSCWGYYSGSVEFRHLEGTLDPELILRFSRLMMALFQFSDKAEPEAYMRLVSQLVECQSWRDYNLDILRGVLEQLCLTDDLEYWQKLASDNRKLPLGPEERAAVMNEQDLEIIPRLHPEVVEILRRDVCQKQTADFQTGITTSSAEKLDDAICDAIGYFWRWLPFSESSTRKNLHRLHEEIEARPASVQEHIYEALTSLIVKILNKVERLGIGEEMDRIYDDIFPETEKGEAGEDECKREEGDTERLYEMPEVQEILQFISSGISGLFYLLPGHQDQSSDSQDQDQIQDLVDAFSDLNINCKN